MSPLALSGEPAWERSDRAQPYWAMWVKLGADDRVLDYDGSRAPLERRSPCAPDERVVYVPVPDHVALIG